VSCQFGDQGALISGNYLVADALPNGVALPTPIQPNYSEINNSLGETPHLGLAFNGQLQSDVGLASGVVVRDTVVLTAAHVVFNDDTLAYVGRVNWFLQKHTGEHDPKPQAARGWYVLSGYASARTNDLPPVGSLSPGVSSAESRNWDVAALYFLSPAACGGYGGYLTSDAPTNQWLVSSFQKMLVGYPVDGASFGYAGVVPGKMHSIPGINYTFALQTNRVYATSGFLSFPGNSGGPVYVLHTNNTYYPAGVYLGTLGNSSVVRAIDSNVVSLINLAGTLGDFGTNNSGGVIRITVGSGSGLLAYIQVHISPQPAGAGWRLQGQISYHTSPDDTESVSPGDNPVIEFSTVANWDGPPSRSVSVALGQTTIIDAAYTRSAQLGVSPIGGLSFSGYAGGPFSPTNVTCTLANSGGASLSWRATRTTNWVTLSATNGTLAAGAHTNITVMINASANRLTAGVYTNTISFTNLTNGLGNTTRSVSLFP
jgi:hypothetical protein